MATLKERESRRTGLSDRYTKYLSFFGDVQNNQKPLAKLFRTSDRPYLYDTGTNKILECSELVFELLQNLFASEVEYAIQSFLAKHGRDAFLLAAEEIIGAMEAPGGK